MRDFEHVERTSAEPRRPGGTKGRTAAAAVEGFFLRHRDRIWMAQTTMVVVFAALVFLPVFLPEAAEDATPLSDFTVFASYAIWGIWFPLVFLSVVVTGRSWCGLLCPMGAASEWCNAAGLKRAIPAWVRWEGTPIVSFLIITILGQTVGVRDHPEAIAEVFGGTALLAVLVGLAWGRRRRAWCRHMCPIGLLLGVFSRLGAVHFTPKSRAEGGDRWVERGPCPTMIDIRRKEESRHCIECFRCVSRSPGNGLSLRPRRPGEEVERIRDHHANVVEVWFLFVGTGIALGGFLWLVLPLFQRLRQALGQWFIEHGWYWIGEPGPWWLMSVHPERREVFVWLDFVMIVGFMLGFAILFCALLAAATAAAAWLAREAGGNGTFKVRFTELGYQYAPVAMVSLVIGLGGELFEALKGFGLGQSAVDAAKGAFFVAALAWSVWLGQRILARQSVPTGRRWLPMLPGVAGSLAVGAAWWTAIFGV